MRAGRTRVLGVGSLFTLLAFSIHGALCEPAAYADESAPETRSATNAVEEARRRFHAAVEREDAGDHLGALSLYREARAFAVSPQLLFNIASCELRLGRLLDASRTFREAKEEATVRDNQEVLHEADGKLAELAALTPRLVVHLPRGAEAATIVLDGHGIDAEAEVRLDPSQHRLVARSPSGADFEMTFTPRYGEVRTIDVVFVERQEQPPLSVDTRTVGATQRPSPERSYVPAAAFGGTAVILGTVAAITFASGRAKKEQLEDLNADKRADTEGVREELKSEGEALYLTSTIFGIGAALAGGAGLYFLLRPVTIEPSTPKRSATSLWVRPQGMGLSFGGEL